MAYKNEYELKVKDKNGNIKSFEDDFSCGVTDFKIPSFETKDLDTNDFKDVDGDDTFYPEDGMVYKGGDFEVDLCYKGAESSWLDTFVEIATFLKSAPLTINLPYTKDKSWNRCHLKTISDVDIFTNPTIGDVVEFKLTFRVDSVLNNGKLFYTWIVDEDGNVVVDENGTKIESDEGFDFIS